jgi:serine/threonine-protein kinase PpkA
MSAATCDQGVPSSAQAPQRGAPQEPAVRHGDATVVYARLHHFSTICGSLAPDQLTSFLNDARRVLSEPILRLGGDIAQRRPDSVLAVFSNEPDARKPDHAQRALHAAILAVYETVQLAGRIASGFQGARVPALTLAVGVNVGEAGIGQRGARGSGMVRVYGEAAEIARLLEVTATDLRWSIAASERTIVAAAGRVERGRIGSVAPPDDSFVDIGEVTGLRPRKGSTTSPEMYEALRESLAQNARAWEPPHDMSQPGVAGVAAPHKLLIEGYRIVRQIGAGGMATVFLAQPQEGPLQVIKMMRIDASAEDDVLQRFIQEFALLAQVDHPNVARILRQDFSAGQAYIVMEYFPGGDLRARIGAGLSCEQAMDYVKQTARGLAAIHAQGIVHRDLKPDNLMLRHDGSLALADFGIAKQVSMLMMDTGHGDIVGTPSYLSPEQARGEAVDARCDLYSLGVLMYELLTGRRPYSAPSAEAMLDLHIHAHVPTLPNEVKHLQPVLSRLMAKDREQRYASAQALLDDLRERDL